MKTSRFLISCVLLSLMAGEAWPQHEGTEQVNALRFLVGDWIGQYTVTTDIPEVGLSAGTRITEHNTFALTFNESAVELTLRMIHEGHPVSISREVACWDPGRGVLAHTIYGEGTFGTGTWHRDGELMVLDWKINTTDNRAYSGRSHLRNDGPDAYTWWMTDQKVNDQPVPDTEKVTFTRVPQGLPEGRDRMKSLSPMIGHWRHEGKVVEEAPGAEAGATMNVDWEWRWILDCQAIETEWTIEISGRQPVKGKSIITWNDGQQQYVEQGVSMDGSRFVGVFHAQSGADGWIRADRGVNQDGVDTSANVHLTLKDKNVLTFQAKDRHGEYTGDGAEYVFTRCH